MKIEFGMDSAVQVGKLLSVRRKWFARLLAAIAWSCLLGKVSAADAPSFNTIDLSGYATRSWDAYKPLASWNGPPGGYQVIGGIPFQIDGLIQIKTLNSRFAAFNVTRIDGIPIQRRFTHLHLLHFSEMASGPGQNVAKLILHYADGQDRSFVLRYGMHFQDWNHRVDGMESLDSDTRYAWMGPKLSDPEDAVATALWHTTLSNPRPEVEVASMDLRTLFSNSRYSLAAATTDTAPVTEPLPVSDQASEIPDPPAQRIRLVDAADGKPIDRAEVQVSVRQPNGTLIKWGLMETDTRGEATIDLSPPYQNQVQFEVRASSSRHAAEYFSLVEIDNRIVPAGNSNTTPTNDVLVLKLKRGETIGGVVQDGKGLPIPEAIVVLSAAEKDSQGNYARGQWPKATTDKKGRWSLNCAPPTFRDIIVKVQAPDFLSATYEQESTNAAPFVVGAKDLLAQEAVFTLKPGEEIQGIITAGGSPLSNASVTVLQDAAAPAISRSIRTSQDAKFSFRGLEPGPTRLLVTADGFSPELRSIENKTNNVLIELHPTKPLLALVRDPSGQPITNAMFELTARTDESWIHHIGYSDAQGQFRWDSPPTNGARFLVAARGFNPLGDVLLTPGVRREIKLQPGPFGVVNQEESSAISPAVTGIVVDAETGARVGSFVVIEDMPRMTGISGWFRQAGSSGTGGSFEYQWRYQIANQSNEPRRLLIEAMGYQPAIVGPITGRTNLMIKLNRGTGPSGILLDTQGHPLAGARLFVLGEQEPVVLENGGTLQSEQRRLSGISDASGKFTLPLILDPKWIVALHPQGFALASIAEMQHGGEIRLQRWGEVTGTVKIGTGLPVGATIVLHNPSQQAEPAAIWASLQSTPDSEGHFDFQQVPPGQRQVAVLFPATPNRYGPYVPAESHGFLLDVASGEVTNVVIGGNGRRVRGQIKIAGNETQIDWHRDAHFLTLKVDLPGTTMRAPPPGLSVEEQSAFLMREQQRVTAIRQSSAGQRALRNERSYFLQFASDGSFFADNIPAGNYYLNLSFTRQGQQAWESVTIAQLNREVTVPEGSAPVDLGEIEIQPDAASGVTGPETPVSTPVKVANRTASPLSLAGYYTDAGVKSWDALPKGQQRFDGVPFEIGGYILLAAARTDHSLLPLTASGIPVEKKFSVLHLLHAAEFNDREGRPIIQIVLHYANGERRVATLVYGTHVRNWYDGPGDFNGKVQDPNTTIAWTGASEDSTRYGEVVRLYHTPIENPLPDQIVSSVDIISLRVSAYPLILAISLEDDPKAAPKDKLFEAEDPSRFDTFGVRIVDAGGQTPITNAHVRVTAKIGPTPVLVAASPSDRQGRLDLLLPAGRLSSFGVSATANGYQPATVTVPDSETESAPKEVTVKLSRGTEIGGTILGKSDQPIAGVTIRIHGAVKDASGQFAMTDLDSVTTDANGRWSSSIASSDFKVLSFSLACPGFADTEYELQSWGNGTALAVSQADLLAKSTVMRMEPLQPHSVEK